MRYFCCDERRLEVVKLHGTLNGLEYLEVDDSGIAGDPTRQLTLLVKFIRPVPPLATDNVRIEGGERIEHVDIDWVAVADNLPATEPASLVAGLDPLDHFLVIRTRFRGDFSLYTLSLVSGAGSNLPPAGLDPRLSTLEFSFKVQCPSDFDCADSIACAPPTQAGPRLDYLAKDYTSFRRLMLDRLSVLVPGWRDRNAADPGVTLVELLAYVGDHLSYQQDAVATEAYLATARRRVSLRRHARLVDYQVHEGCCARVWARIDINDDGVNIPAHTLLLTRVPGAPERIAAGSDALRDALAAGPEVFETVEDTLLYQAHARMPFHAWGERQCCLPHGATRVTLEGHFPNLKAGDVLALVEELGPRTGLAEDADRSHRHAVRLTHVQRSEDPSGGLFAPTPSSAPTPVTEIAWSHEDALPFALCLSAITDVDHGETWLPQVSGAYGNLVLADHGRTLDGEPLGVVPEPRVAAAPPGNTPSCERPAIEYIAPRFRPVLQERPLTHVLDARREHRFTMSGSAAIVADLTARTYSAAVQGALQAQGVVLDHGPVSVQGGDGVWSVSDGASACWIRLEAGELEVHDSGAAATHVVRAAPHLARPAIHLESSYQGQTARWQSRLDLLASGAEAAEFVVESEYGGLASIRFGDDVNGKRPDAGTAFTATYRIGNGAAGNIGLESIVHVVSADARLVRASNPLPARGGVDPESNEAIRRDAPQAFRIQERAVTEKDYAQITERHASVQRAASSFRWTGSWHSVFLTVDRLGGGDVDAGYESTILGHVERYRMAGYDLEVDAPRYVALEVAMKACVAPDYFRADVRAALVRVFSRGWLADGTPALFHPDNFTFGQPVYLSALYAAAEAVQGVASVVIETFQRLHEPGPGPLEDGALAMNALEIARLDNDRNFPERGVFRLSVGGGK